MRYMEREKGRGRTRQGGGVWELKESCGFKAKNTGR